MTLLMLAQQSADSLAAVIGSDVGATASALVLLVLGVINKAIVSGAKFVLEQKAKLPSFVQIGLAAGFAQLVAFVNAKFGTALSGDISTLAIASQGLVIWVASMGWHSVSKNVLPKSPTA